MDKKKKIAWKISGAVLVVVLGINLLTVLFSVTDLRTRLQWLPYAVLEVESGSMEPAFSTGDLLIVQETDFSSLQIGDDVTFHQVDELVTHRIVGKSGNYFITQGLANNTPDPALLGPEEYCAKVVRVLPSMGGLLAYLTSPLSIGLTALLLLAALFGIPAASNLFDEHFSAGAEKPKPRVHLGRRLLVFTAAMSLLLVSPFMTAAKYTAKLNHYEMAVGSALYFSSNYLSEEGNRYSVQGWNGEEYNLTLAIKNYDNDLLSNAAGTDLIYGLAVEKISGDDYSTDYTVSVVPVENSGVSKVDDASFTFPDSWGAYDKIGKYSMIGGETKLENRFRITITPNGTFDPNTQIRFKVHACTSENKQYFMQMVGDFTLKVAETQEFIGEATLQDQGLLVKYSIKTNLINEGTSTKLVKFQWDPTKLYINEFESSAYNVIINWPKEYYDKEHGIIYIPLQAYSSVNLQFFKVDPGFEPTVADITATIVDAVG